MDYETQKELLKEGKSNLLFLGFASIPFIFVSTSFWFLIIKIFMSYQIEPLKIFILIYGLIITTIICLPIPLFFLSTFVEFIELKKEILKKDGVNRETLVNKNQNKKMIIK